jgi:hypothetical protein
VKEIEFERMLKTEGGFMPFNQFLSTSIDELASLAFTESNRDLIVEKLIDDIGI